MVSSAFETIKSHGINLIMYSFFFTLSNAYFSLLFFIVGQHYYKKSSIIFMSITWFLITSTFSAYRVWIG